MIRVKDFISVINRTLLNEIAATASIMSLYLTAYPFGQGRPDWHPYALSMATFYIIYSIYGTIMSAFNNRKVTYSDDEIDDFMCEWVGTRGQTVVFSRDLSWGCADKAKTTLLRKSQANEITLYVERQNSISYEMEQAGAKVFTYHVTGHRPRSRFTIVNFGREGARLAVGLPEGNKHAVYFFEQGRDPIFSIAEDLIKFLNGMQGRQDA